MRAHLCQGLTTGLGKPMSSWGRPTGCRAPWTDMDVLFSPRAPPGKGIRVNMVKPHGGLVLVGSCVTAFRPPAYQPGYLPGSFRGIKSPGLPHLEGGFPLRCFQRLSLPSIATQRLPLARQQVHRCLVRPGPLVLRSDSLKSPTPTTDRDRTVSRRSEPSSRTALMGEQPNPWDLLQPQDAMSRHRGAKPCRRCGLLGKISLLSPEYLLSVK